MPQATAPQRTDYVFQGYFDSITGGTQYYSSDMKSIKTWDKNSSTKLYAQWSYGTNGLAYRFNSSSNSYTVTGIGSAISNNVIRIPETYNNIKVTEIGARAFKDNTRLKTIFLPNGLTLISDEAFSGCTNLTNIDIPRTVETINRLAFYKCSLLDYMFIPINVTSVGPGAFHDCSPAIIYVEATSKPNGWIDNWTNCTVKWGWKKY